VTSVVLDGEAMCFTDGMHDFDKLWNNCFDETVRLCAFYLLELNGEDYRGKPLAERKKRLARLLARPRDGIEYVEHLEGDGSRIFEHACKLGLSAATIKRMLRSTHLPEPARRVIQEYIEQKCAGESGTVSQEYVCFARSLVKCCEDKRVGWPGLDAAIGHPSPCGRCNHEQL
jgi:hypothetical protein